MSDTLDEDGLQDDYDTIQDLELMQGELAAKRAKQQQDLDETDRQMAATEKEIRRVKTQAAKKIVDRHAGPAKDASPAAKESTTAERDEGEDHGDPKGRRPATPEEIKKLESQISQARPYPAYTPPGFGRPVQTDADREKAKMVEQMKADYEKYSKGLKSQFDGNAHETGEEHDPGHDNGHGQGGGKSRGR